MALYEYLCADCGPFSALRPMAESSLPQPCPECGALSARAWITPPAIFGLPAAVRQAHATNERARHEPRLASHSASGHVHGPGCGCGGRSKATHTAPGGEKSFPSKRPWMISH